MNDTSLTDWQELVAMQGLKKLMNKDWFDICTLDEIASILKIHKGGSLRDELHVLHCVNYRDLHPDIVKALPEKILEYLTPAFSTIEIREMMSKFNQRGGTEIVVPAREPSFGKRLLSLVGG